MSRFFPQEDGYAPGDSANPVRSNAGDFMLPSALAQGGRPNVPIVGIALVAGGLYVLEHMRHKRSGKRR